MDKKETLEEVIQRCKDAGVTHFHYFDISDENYPADGCPDWHWDIYSEDPHRWFHIPKPWTIRFCWLGNSKNQKSNPNRFLRSRYFGGFPFFVMVDSWIFTYYRGAKNMGCQCTTEKNIRRGLEAAYVGFCCESDCSKCSMDCESQDIENTSV